MYYVDNNSGSPTMPALSPAQSNIPTWFTEGDKNKGISWIGQDWLNILQAELLNVLSEAGIKPDKGKLNQLTLSIKAIVTANAYTQANNLKEIFDAGIAAQAAARSHLGLGKLATKDSLGPADVNALAKDQNLADVPDKALARQSLQLGNSATRNVGTTVDTVAAGDDSRITGAMQKDQNGADIPDKPGFIKNVGLKETLNPTKRVSIGNIGTGAFDGSTPSINIGDSDSGFIGSADGVIDIYANNQRVGRFSQGAFELLRTLVLRDAANAVGADTNFSTMLNTYDATGNLRWAWGPYKGGWDVHSYDQNGAWRNNPLHIDYRTSEVSVPCNFHVAGAMVAIDGNIYGTRWNANGAWLWDAIAEQLAIRDNNINTRATIDYVNQTFVRDVRAGNVESAQVWRAYGYNDQAPYVITGVINGNTDDLIDNLTRRPLQKNINGVWYNIGFI